jgi:hypothetical protein
MKKTLLFLLLPFFSNAQIFQSGFESVNGPLSQWTLYNQDNLTPNTNVSYVNGAWVQSLSEFDNNVALSTSWYTPAGVSNDWMVSPAISLPSGSSTLYWQARAYDATYPDSYKVYVSTTGNTPSDFTTPLLTVGNGTLTGESNTWQNKSIDLSSFAGQTVYIAFQNFSNDMFLLGIDNVYVVSGTCPSPARLMTNSNIGLNSGTFNWTAATGGITEYEYSWGTPGHTPTVTNTVSTNSVTMNSLTSNTRYQYFVRSKSGTNRGGWIGPYSLFTAVAGAPSYNYGFDNANGFSSDGWSGAWSTNATAGNPQSGSQMTFSNSSTTVGTPTNRWLFSRPIYLVANSTNVIKFYLRNFGVANAQSIKMTIGNEPLVASQTNTLWTSSTIANTTWTEYTVNYSPTSTGVYYLGFHHFTPGVAGGVSLGLDSFSLTSTLSSENFETYNFEIYPNPVTTMLNISNINNVEIKNISVTDINGRVVKNQAGSLTQINVSDLNAGVYFVTIEAAEGKTTQKFIKE